MFVRRFIVGSLAVLSIGFSFASSIDTTLFKDIEIYNLKNLESDLKKNINIEKSQIACEEIWCGVIPNYYQIDSIPDKDIRKFLVLLKRKRYTQAARLYNQYSGTLYPKEYPVDYFSNDFGVIPFHEGLIGLISEGQDSIPLKFYYIVIKKNILYRIRMNETLVGGLDFGSLSNNDIIKLGNTLSKSDYQKRIDTLPVVIEDGDTQFSVGTTIDNIDSRILGYLQGKEKSKELDERQNAFKEKVKKLFK